MRGHFTYLLLGVALVVAGLFALITGNAGERDYGEVVVVGLSGWGVRLAGLIMAIFGGYVIYTEFKALIKK